MLEALASGPHVDRMADDPEHIPEWIEITPEMVKAASSALYEDDWGMEHPHVTAERALRRALAVAPWAARLPNSPSPKRSRKRKP